MNLTEIASAVPLIAKRADLRRRMGMVSSGQTLDDIYQALYGTGLEDNVLTQARQQVSDFLQKAVTDIEGQLVALGVDLKG